MSAEQVLTRLDDDQSEIAAQIKSLDGSATCFPASWPP